MEIFREFRFEAAHRLANLPEGHKCRRVHGHSYRVIVHVSGPIARDTGWVIDFAEVKRSVQPLIDQLDHQLLNEVEGLGQPTTENVARWLWSRARPALPGLSKIVVHETDHAGCIYTGDDGASATPRPSAQL